LKGITEHTQLPNNHHEESEHKKSNDADDNCLGTPRQSPDKEFYLDMPAEDQGHAGSKGNGHYLGKHHDVNGTIDTPEKDLAPYYIDAGNNHHHEQPCKPYPLKPTAYLAIKPFKRV
jgi:hypothetical protein